MTTLVLLPGMDGTGKLFEPFINSLNNDFKIQVVQYPNDTKLEYNELEKFIIKLLPKDESIILLGESFSGPLAISIATQIPQIKVLILCCTFIKSPSKNLQRLLPVIKYVPIKIIPNFILNYLLIGNFSTKILSFNLKSFLSQIPHKILLSRLKSISNVNVSKQLSTIQIPILYLKAKNDLLVKETSLALILELNPNIEIVRFNSSHLLLQTKPLEVSIALNSFLNKQHLLFNN